MLFSSAASLFGTVGQSNYAAANAFLDGLAHYRRARGQVALSVNWGSWSEVGMASELGQAQRRQRKAMGFDDIAPEQGTAALERLLIDGAIAQCAVSHPLAGVRQTFGRDAPPLVADWVAHIGSASDLRGVLAGRRWPLAASAAAQVAAQTRKVLGIAATEPLDETRAVQELGMDSVMAVELLGELSRAFGIQLSTTKAFDYPTVVALSDHLLAELELDQESSDEPLAEQSALAQPKPMALPRAGSRIGADCDRRDGVPVSWRSGGRGELLEAVE